MRLFAAAKGVRTEEINIHLKIKPEWYVNKINPVGKVPTIQLLDGRLIPESLIAAGEPYYINAALQDIVTYVHSLGTRPRGGQ